MRLRSSSVPAPTGSSSHTTPPDRRWQSSSSNRRWPSSSSSSPRTAGPTSASRRSRSAPPAGKSAGRAETGALIVGLRRRDGGYDTTPSPDTRLEDGDMLIVVGTAEELRAVEDLFAPRPAVAASTATADTRGETPPPVHVRAFTYAVPAA